MVRLFDFPFQSGHIVERVTLSDGNVSAVLVRPEAGPFYISAEAPPERFELPTQALGRPRSIL